jgi:N-dimethylarginine dimethylaminohydrolase
MIEVLMCPPDYYTVRYKINPWMNPRRKPDETGATAQWSALHETLLKVGVRVSLVNPVPDLPDMVFTANAGLVFSNDFILSNFRYPQRRPESAYFEAWAESKGMKVRHLPPDHYFEGEGDALFFKVTLIAGYRFRSDVRSHLHVSSIIEREVLSVELINPDYYHLDTCFCPLNDTSALFYPDAFDSYGRKVLERIVPNLIPLSKQDARKFCSNAVVNGTDIIMNRCSTSLQETLEALGFVPHLLEFNEYIKAGGSSKCMVLFLSR